MTLNGLINRPCTITHRSAGTERNEFGDEIPAETTTETVCELQQRQRSEDSDRGEISSTGWVLFLPYDTLLATGDTVTVGGVSYEVDGEPWAALDPEPHTGDDSHIEASLKRTTAPDDPREQT